MGLGELAGGGLVVSSFIKESIEWFSLINEFFIDAASDVCL